jgi:hypothetical protein
MFRSSPIRLWDIERMVRLLLVEWVWTLICAERRRFTEFRLL